MSISQLPKKLKWHNTLPEDFNMQPALSASSSSSSRSPLLVNRKRHSTSFENIDPSDFSHTLNHSASDAQISLVDPSRWFSSSALHSPTKRQRPSSFSAKTPTKFNPLSGQPGNAQDSGSGMQTPPPSSTGTGRKRGKPLKGVLTSSLPRSRVLSPPQTSPTTPFSSTENLFLDQSELDKHHLIKRIAGSELKIPISVSGKPARFLPKSIVWDGALGYSTGLGLSTDDTEASASFDWSSLRRNSSIGDISDIFSSTPTSRPRDRLPSLPRFDDASDPVQYSFVQFGEPDGLPLDVDPNLLFSSSTSVASSMIGGLDDIGLLSLPYQHQHMQQKREQELEVQKERRLLERQSRLGRSQERILVTSYKAPATGKENSRGSSRKSLRSFKDDENVSPPPQFRKNMSRSVRKHRAILSPVKGPKGRTQVTLSISPGGHAKTETTVIYSDSETEIDEGLSCAECNSPEESDSSFDHETPRGLAPDGRGYITFRRRISADPFLDTNPPSSTPKKTRHELLPRTPTRLSPFKSLPGSSAKVRAFAASTAAAATTVSSSPKLPTPIMSSPAPRFSQHPLIGCAKRVGKARNGVTITSSALGISSTGYIQQEVGDESEAETVVDSIDINEPEHQEEDGDALTALRKAMTLRRTMIATNRATSPQRTPTKSRPGSAVKVYSNSVSRSDVRRNQAHPSSLLSPVKKKLFQTAPTAQNRSRSHRRKPADGGFFHQDQSSANTSPTTITDPECRTPRALSLELGNDDDDGTRCVCGVTDDDGGTTMVQCDSCNNWLHMRCLGYNSRKLLPVVFVCTFCTALTPGKNGRVTRGADKRLSMNTAMMAKKRPSSWPLKERAEMSARLHQNM